MEIGAPIVLVSVIVPVYNVLPYLRESLESVINQTYEDLEIIIVDDGSTDGSDVVCEEYSRDSRVKVIHQKNHGLSAARNVGLDLARGDYIAFLDSDDVYLPDMIQTMVEGIKKSRADIEICGFNKVYSKGNITKKRIRNKRGLIIKKEEILSREDALKHVIDKLRPCVWNKLYKKEVWDELRFPIGRVFEDTWIIPPMFENIKMIHVIPRALILYRQRAGSLSATINVKNIEDKIEARIYLENYINMYSSKASDKESFMKFYEDNVRKLSFCYAELVHLKGKDEKTEDLKTEILKRWDTLDENMIGSKSKFIRMLFKKAPSLIFPFMILYNSFERFL